MAVAIEIPSLPHQNLSHCNVDMAIVSFDFVPNLDYPLRVGEILVDARCDLLLLEPYNFPLKKM